MTRPDSEKPVAAATQELTVEELDVVAGGGKATTPPKEKPQQYLVLTMESVLVS